MLGPPSLCSFLFAFQRSPSPSQRTYFLNDPFDNFQRENVFLQHFIYTDELLKIFLRHFNFAFWARNFILQHFNFAVELKKYFSRIQLWTAKFSCHEKLLPESNMVAEIEHWTCHLWTALHVHYCNSSKCSLDPIRLLWLRFCENS